MDLYNEQGWAETKTNRGKWPGFASNKWAEWSGNEWVNFGDYQLTQGHTWGRQDPKSFRVHGHPMKQKMKFDEE